MNKWCLCCYRQVEDSKSIYCNKCNNMLAGMDKVMECNTGTEQNTIYKPINPEYIKLAKIAYDTVIATMQEGEKTHPEQGWQTADHIDHIMQHAYLHHNGDTSEDHIGHALMRCAMIKAMQK